MAKPIDCPYVSRGGIKLAAALKAFDYDVSGMTCADLGCSTGGFVDCLLQQGAAHVFAVDTAYGQLAWKLRQDDRVTVIERTNALHVSPRGACDLVTVDLGWTKQMRAIPAALSWLKAEPGGHILSLIKPHYESGQPRLTDAQALAIHEQVLSEVMPTLGVEVLGHIPSPIHGGKGKNLEFLALLRPTGSDRQVQPNEARP